MTLMLDKLESNPEKIPSPNRDDMMRMTVNAFSEVTDQRDYSKAFKTLFVTNALDGSEDYMVSDNLQKLIGKQIREFRENLMREPPPKNLNELLKTITPPKGIRRKNIEGSELHDCEGEEIENIDEHNEIDEGNILLFRHWYKLDSSLYQC